MAMNSVYNNQIKRRESVSEEERDEFQSELESISPNNEDEETEDEEVKMNCMRSRGDESESEQEEEFDSANSSSSSDNESSDGNSSGDSQEEEESEEEGVVQFVSQEILQNQQPSSLVRPRAIVSRASPNLSSQDNNDTPSQSSESVSSSPSMSAMSINYDVSSLRSCDDASSGEDENESPKANGSKDDSEHSSMEDKAMRQSDDGCDDEVIQFEADAETTPVHQCRASKNKRVLSCNTLAALNVDAGRNDDTPKRLKTTDMLPKQDELSNFSLGPSAMSSSFVALPRGNQMRDSPVMSSDDEELDQRLSEELDNNSRNGSVNNSPVPLLTPPQSPLTIPIGNNDTATMCEWPSNLVVDSALMSAVTDTRPLSPAALQDLEKEEEMRLARASKSMIGSEASALTPLLRSIYVGME